MATRLPVVVASAWLGHRWLTKGKQATDDAQVDSDVVPVASRVGGVVQAARVHDNQLVKAGEVLFERDPTDSTSRSRAPTPSSRPRTRNKPRRTPRSAWCSRRRPAACRRRARRSPGRAPR